LGRHLGTFGASTQAHRQLLEQQEPAQQRHKHQQQQQRHVRAQVQRLQHQQQRQFQQRPHPHSGPSWRSHCERYESLYESGIWEDTVFWQEGGITEGLMGAAIGNMSLNGGRYRQVAISAAIVKGRLYLPAEVYLNMT
ncbi:hypothetical protein Agub_g5646, partial [Astrephomene gubernaculifera]